MVSLEFLSAGCSGNIFKGFLTFHSETKARHTFISIIL